MCYHFRPLFNVNIESSSTIYVAFVRMFSILFQRIPIFNRFFVYFWIVWTKTGKNHLNFLINFDFKRTFCIFENFFAFRNKPTKEKKIMKMRSTRISDDRLIIIFIEWNSKRRISFMKDESVSSSFRAHSRLAVVCIYQMACDICHLFALEVNRFCRRIFREQISIGNISSTVTG